MFLRIVYPEQVVPITAVVSHRYGTLYWKARDICNILYFMNVGEVLRTYLGNERVLRYEDVLNLKGSKTFVLTYAQTMKLLATIPKERQNRDFENWFININAGFLKVFPEKPEQMSWWYNDEGDLPKETNSHTVSITLQTVEPQQQQQQPDDENEGAWDRVEYSAFTLPEFVKGVKSKIRLLKPTPPKVNPSSTTTTTIATVATVPLVKTSSTSTITITPLGKTSPVANTTQKMYHDTVERVQLNYIQKPSSSLQPPPPPVPPAPVPVPAQENGLLDRPTVDPSQTFVHEDSIFGGKYTFFAVELHWNENGATPITVYPFVGQHNGKYLLYVPVKHV